MVLQNSILKYENLKKLKMLLSFENFQMEFQEYDFILNLGCKIRNILYSTEDYSKVNWVDNSIEEYNENQNFSSTTLNNLLNFLNDYHELKEDFSKVFFDDECPQNRQILLETIFFEDNNEKFE